MSLNDLYKARHALLRCILASDVTPYELVAELGRIKCEIEAIVNPLRELKVA